MRGLNQEKNNSESKKNPKKPVHIWQSWNVVAVKTITYWISETNEVQDFVNLVKIKYTVTVLKHNIDILHIL